MKKIDLLGQTFGLLTVVGEAPGRKDGQVTWVCRCECGNETSVRSANLRRKTRSCGCVRNVHNGASTHPIFDVWRGMIARCYREDSISYHNYGGRGIRVCAEWRKSFATFLKDMGDRPSPRHTLDRIDGTGNYESENCRWVTWKTQARNRRGNNLILHDGETKTLAGWAERTGIGRATISYRLRNGWTVAEALSRTPHCGKPPEVKV